MSAKLSTPELVRARLARIQALLDEVEQTCQQSAELRRTFEALRSEIEASHAALLPVHRGLYGESE